MSLYLETLTDRTAFNQANFKEEMYMGLWSKWLGGRIIKIRAATDQEMLADMLTATAEGLLLCSCLSGRPCGYNTVF